MKHRARPHQKDLPINLSFSPQNPTLSLISLRLLRVVSPAGLHGYHLLSFIQMCDITFHDTF